MESPLQAADQLVVGVLSFAANPVGAPDMFVPVQELGIETTGLREADNNALYKELVVDVSPLSAMN